ncbi:YbhB/YbcL family Raf kinase inhibitor-like protein [Aspergillus clavatus NRRL 1]|uniref:Phosphatidylethanolamine-binding protein n=1 Tax=Aspergillus clavatus (strain ATCC 1007 / CBS 513.65 / DSM 816 / NCTC 3887 / NRRL 1 / QM 1276 / 107) TaxID=344612 RepID=A1C7M0_ASPCL|nr:uncharacterized protein ACLA_074280 [Aspergillus clavatus NRRL 1]EAW14391.1 conserved hypothetical protein [Aspergillus clavatus NRRL 1]
MSMSLFLFLLVTTIVAATRWPLPPALPTLELRYPSTPWISPGDTLKRPKTLQLPCIGTENLDITRTHLLLFIDLDVIWGTRSTTVLHWYQPDMTVSRVCACTDDGIDWLVNATSPGAEYIAPQPPPLTRHRYVYLLYEQDPEYVFPECFGHIFPQTMEARAGFDIRQFVHAAGLRPPVAGNFFFVDNDESTTRTMTTTPPGREMSTTTWLTSAPCRTDDVEPTPSAYTEQYDGVENQQIVI